MDDEEKGYRILTAELTNNKTVDTFIKFQTKERLEALREKGYVYMNNINYYITLEEKYRKEGQGDRHEADMFVLKDGYVVNPLTQDTVLTFKEANIKLKHIGKKPAFCMTGYNKMQDMVDDNTARIKVSQALVDDFKPEDEELYALIILKPQIFIDRLREALRANDIKMVEGLVTYTDTSMPIIDIKNKILYVYTPFHKREKFMHQDEYRVLVGVNANDYYDLSIGSLEDISVIVRAQDLVDGVLIRLLN